MTRNVCTESFLYTAPASESGRSALLPKSTMEISSEITYPSRQSRLVNTLTLTFLKVCFYLDCKLRRRCSLILVPRQELAEAVEESRHLRKSWLRAEEGWKSALGAAQALKQKLISVQSELAEKDALIDDLQEEKDRSETRYLTRLGRWIPPLLDNNLVINLHRMQGTEGSLKQQLDNEKKVTARATSLLADINEKLAMTMAER